MKKLLLIMIAGFALACGPDNQSSDRGEDNEIEGTTPADPDLSIHRDSTTSGGMNRPNQYDTLK